MGNIRKKSRPIQRLKGLANEVLERWEGGLEKIGNGVGMREGDRSRDPGDRDTAFLQREVYRLVNELMAPEYRGRLEDVLLYKLGHAPRISFDKSPYFWALKAAKGDEGIELSDDQVIRYGQALGYAAKHRIPVELLPGFLHQVGGTRSIKRKLEAGSVEDWFHPNLAWMPDEAQSASSAT